MNFRSKNTALVLCFFFGCFGAHWYYLGRDRWGGMYLAAALLTNPVAGFIWASFPIIGALLMLFSLLAAFGLLAIVCYDFFNLVCMHPLRFDSEFNGLPPTVMSP